MLWANQFDNSSNLNAHFNSTGPEIWEQTCGKVDGFICAIGSGGTIAGVAKYLKKKIQKYKLGYLILMDQHFIIISKSMK